MKNARKLADKDDDYEYVGPMVMEIPQSNFIGNNTVKVSPCFFELTRVKTPF